LVKIVVGQTHDIQSDGSGGPAVQTKASWVPQVGILLLLILNHCQGACAFPNASAVAVNARFVWALICKVKNTTTESNSSLGKLKMFENFVILFFIEKIFNVKLRKSDNKFQ
jgi:hypothetical protein